MNKKNLIISYIEFIDEFAKVHFSQLVSYNTQVIYINGKKTLNITNNIPNKAINIYRYHMKTIFTFQNFKIIITFTGSDCSLDSVVVFNSDIDKREYSFYELTNVIGKNDFKKYSSLWLYDEQKLKIAFNWIFTGMAEYLQSISELSTNEALLSELRLNWEHDTKVLSECSECEIKLHNKGYELFCKNEYETAITNYSSSIEKLTIYNQRVLKFMKEQLQNEKEKEYIVIPNMINECKIKDDIDKKNKGEKSITHIFITFFILLGGIPHLIIYYAYYAILGEQYIIKYDSSIAFMCGIVLGFAMAEYFNKYLLKIIFKSGYYEYMNIQKIKANMPQSKIKEITFVIAIIFFVFVFFMALKQNLIFKENGFIDNTSIFTNRIIKYEDTYAIYEVKSYKDNMGKIVIDTSYAIKLNDGRVIDLRSIGDIDEKTIRFLKSKNILFKEVEFIENIDYE